MSTDVQKIMPRRLGNANGALFIMRHFAEVSGQLVEPYATKMANSIREYWKQIGIERPKIAICSTEKRSKDTARALGFSDDEIIDGSWNGQKDEIDLGHLCNTLALYNKDTGSALYVGHAPQVHRLWTYLNSHKTEPVIADQWGRQPDEAKAMLLKGTDVEPLLLKASKIRDTFKRSDYEHAVYSLKACNSYSYTPSVVSNDNGDMFWAAHNEERLVDAFNKRSFIDGETFIPGWAADKPVSVRMPGLSGLIEGLIEKVIPKKSEMPEQGLKAVERAPVI